MTEIPHHTEHLNHTDKGNDGLIEPDVTSDERLWATLIHLTNLLPLLSFIPLLAIWLMKKDESYFVDDHGRETLNFQISMFLWHIAAGLLVFCGIGIILAPVLGIFSLIICIINAVRANQGQYVRYPITIRFID